MKAQIDMRRKTDTDSARRDSQDDRLNALREEYL